jgi:hypothetical protein
LTAVLCSMQTEITPNSLPIVFTTGLRSALDGLSDAVAAIPTTEIRVAGGYQQQARFSISNAAVDLNLALGIWEWRVLPQFSQIQRDASRLLHVRMGHLPLEPSSDCLWHFPLASDLSDMVGGLHLVQRE